ncbi:MAG TPA: SgcJ/EcaC family oxidoreductase [Pyrinomonadaceae bacterium]
MIRQTLFAAALVFAFAAPALAQNAASSTPRPAAATRPRTSAPKTNATPAAAAAGEAQQDTTPAPAPPPTSTTGTGAARPALRRQSAADVAQTRAVRAAFDTLIDGIRRADAKAVMDVYWNSPQLVLFNNNGTVTKSWEQVRQNRESLYAKVSDVKLDVRDVQVRLLGPSAAVVSCLWEQSQTADGQPERATGRLSLVFQKVGTAWKAVHAHTSPDRPDPSRLLPSERTTTTTPAEPPAAKP